MKQEASTKKRGPDILVYLIAFLQLQLREDQILLQSHYRTKVHLVQFLNQANYWLKNFFIVAVSQIMFNIYFRPKEKKVI